MDFRKLIDQLDSINSEAKEKVREPYTIAKAVQDINNIAVSEPSKSDTRFSSANIKRFADKKTEIAYKIRELSSRIKNNDELSIYLSDLANMITGDPHNIKERPTQQHMDLIKTAILKHKEMDNPRDPDSDIPYDDNADDDDEPKEDLAQDLAHMKDLVKGIAKNPFKGDKVAKKINKKHGKDLAGNDLKKEGQYDGKSREELLKMKADAEASMKDMKSSGNDPQSKFYDETQMMMAQQHLDSINNALKKLGVTQEGIKVTQEAQMDANALKAWYNKYEDKQSWDAYGLAHGFFKWKLDSGIATDSMERSEVQALIKKFGEEEVMDDPFAAMEKAPELAPITTAMHDEFSKIVGKKYPDEEDFEKASNLIQDIDEAVKENINLNDKELADAVFKAIDLADKLGVNYAVDKVAEFAEDLYSAVNGTNESINESLLPKSHKVLKLVIDDIKKLKAEQDEMAKQGYDEDVEMIQRRLKDLIQIADLVKDGGYIDGVDTAVQDEVVDYYSKAGEPLSFAKEATNESKACNCDENCPCGGNCGDDCNCQAGCSSMNENSEPEWFQGLTNVTLNGDEFYETFGWIGIDEDTVEEAEYQGRKVKLGKPMRGDVKKFKVYVKNPKGNVVKVNFGDPDMKIKKSNPARRKSFRARHNCDSPGPRHKARYWSCRKW